MTSDLFPSWEHPGMALGDQSMNSHPELGGSSRMDHSSKSMSKSMSISVKGSKKKRSSKLKDPPLSSIYAKKSPPSYKTNRGGDQPRKPRRGGPVVDAIPSSYSKSKDADRDSTTCEETRSVSDNSSSLQTPSAASNDQNLLMSGSSKRAPMPDIDASAASSNSLKNPPIPRQVESPVPSTSRYGTSSPSRPARRRSFEEGQPPPLEPYGDDRYDAHSHAPPRNQYQDDYYHGDSRSRRPPHDRYDDDNMSRASRYPDDRSHYPDDRSHYPDDRSHYPDDRSHYPDDRSHYGGGGGGGYPPRDRHSPRQQHPHSHRHPHDPYEDDNVSRVSRYHEERPGPGRFSRGGGSLAEGSHHSRELSVSHASRYTMDRATGYHHAQGRDRYYDDERSGRYPPPQHNHRRGGGGGYDDRYNDRDRDNGSTIGSSYPRYDRDRPAYPHDNGYPDHGGRNYPPRRPGRYDHQEPPPYQRGRDDYARSDDLYAAGRSTHSSTTRDSQSYHHARRERGGYPGDGGGYAHARPGASAERGYGNDDLYEAKMRAMGMQGGPNKDGGDREGDVYVDIGCGTKAKLRRTKETMEAISNDFYAPASCLACACELFCIADVKYIVCPQCKTISPAEAASSGGTATSYDGTPSPRHGVGLGFTYETLFRMQSEVMQKRGEERLKTGY